MDVAKRSYSLLFHKFWCERIAKNGWRMARNAKIGPPVVLERLRRKVTWLTTRNICVVKDMVVSNECHTSPALASCLVAGSAIRVRE